MVDLVDVPVVFVGYGVEAPEYDWDGFKGEDVMKIRVERRGVAGNVQWQDLAVKVKVGPA